MSTLQDMLMTSLSIQKIPWRALSVWESHTLSKESDYHSIIMVVILRYRRETGGARTLYQKSMPKGRREVLYPAEEQWNSYGKWWSLWNVWFWWSLKTLHDDQLCMVGSYIRKIWSDVHYPDHGKILSNTQTKNIWRECSEVLVT